MSYRHGQSKEASHPNSSDISIKEQEKDDEQILRTTRFIIHEEYGEAL
jgi:hypothetical protein